MTRVSVAHRPEITHGADMIIHLARAAGPLQVGVTSRRQAAAPARDAGPTGFATESAKSPEAAQGDDDCSDDGRREGDYSKHAGKDDYSRDGKGDHSKHDSGWKGVKNDDCQPRKDYCQPQKDYCDPKPSDNCGKRDSYRNPGEALAEIDFSRW